MSRDQSGMSDPVGGLVEPQTLVGHLPLIAQAPRGSASRQQPSEIRSPAADGTPPRGAPDEAPVPDDTALPGVDAPANELLAVDATTREAGIPADSTSVFYDKLDLQFAVDLLDKGGPVVVILLALSVIALTVVVIKIWQFTWLGVGRGRNAENALAMWIAGRRDDAYAAIRKETNPSARVLAHGMRGITAGAQERIVREDVERVALTQIANLRAYMRVIEATVQIAPLLGLFGTVVGMISAFQALQAAGSETDPAVLAGGIWVALLTTAVGLSIAIPAAFINYWLDGRIEREKDHMEAVLTGLFTERITDLEHASTAHRPGAEKEIKLAAE